jgi:hypothetical protein
MRVVRGRLRALAAALALGGCSFSDGADPADVVVGRAAAGAAEAIVGGLGARVEVVGEVVVDECVNDGSGPYGPTSRRNLNVAEGTTTDDVVAFAEGVLESRGYVLEEPTQSGNPLIENVLAARRAGDPWDAVVRIQSAPSSETLDLMVFTTVDPQPTCESRWD